MKRSQGLNILSIIRLDVGAGQTLLAIRTKLTNRRMAVSSVGSTRLAYGMPPKWSGESDTKASLTYMTHRLLSNIVSLASFCLIITRGRK
jgi:hypothetical protein